MVANPGYLDERELGQRIHFAGGRREDEIDCVTRTDLDVFLKRSWVSRVVLVGTELERIDKNADHTYLAFGFRRFDELLVPDVQGTHCRNQTDGLVRPA